MEHDFAALSRRTFIGGVWGGIAGDALWVCASIVVLVSQWDALTSLGAVFIVIASVAVVDFMLLKMKGLSDRRRFATA